MTSTNGKMVVHRGKRQVLSDGQPVKLTYTEFKIISVLSSKPGGVFSRPQIVQQLDARQATIGDRSVDVQVVGLRRKLGRLGSSIDTIRGGRLPLERKIDWYHRPVATIRQDGKTPR
jgi:two-component system phosphate regulon response regulator PhoB